MKLQSCFAPTGSRPHDKLPLKFTFKSPFVVHLIALISLSTEEKRRAIISQSRNAAHLIESAEKESNARDLIRNFNWSFEESTKPFKLAAEKTSQRREMEMFGQSLKLNTCLRCAGGATRTAHAERLMRCFEEKSVWNVSS